VEGDRFFADILACTLGLHGHEVAIAHSAREGVRRGQTEHPDVVVAAWTLKGDMHGGEVCRRIHAAWPSAKAIVITGDQECVFEAGQYCDFVESVITKPFHREEIIEAVHQALAGQTVVSTSPPPISSYSEQGNSYHLLNLG
jgi:CheY-like chemotaxis protein